MNVISLSAHGWFRTATAELPARNWLGFVIRIISFLLVGCSVWPDFVNAEERVSYQMRLITGPAIEVSVQFRGNASGETVLSLAKEWGGIINDDQHVSQVKASDEQGEQIQIEHPSATEWRLSHRPNATIHFQYVIPKTDDRPAVTGNDYRTRVDEDFFQCIGFLGLIIPRKIDQPRQMDQPSDEQRLETRPSDTEFSIQFVGFDTASWQVVSSFGKGAGPFTLVCRPEKFLQTVILAGELQIVERTIRDQQVAVAVYGRNWSFGPDELADAVEKIVTTEREFFDDHNDPWFLVTLTPVSIDSPNSFSLGGTALHGAFALFCSENLTLSNVDPKSLNAYSLLAHEYFHNWNGTKIPTAGDDPSTYWFSEGFTNYFARRMLLAAGLINEEQYGRMLSEAVARHDDNPFRTEKNDRIRSEFWTNRQIQDLPYSRGELIAVVLDQHIRDRSNGEKSLDDFMRDLFRNPLQESPVTTDVLLERLSSWVEPEVLRAVSGWVTDGVAVDLPARLTSPDLQLSLGTMRQFDANFDVEKSRTGGQIEGVAGDSEAFKAGLRNGQSLRRYSVMSGDGQSPPTAEVEVLTDGEVKTIRYTAIGPPKTVRQYVLRKE